MYISRLVDAQLSEFLTFAGFVVIEGPKAVGKTETAKQAAKSIIQFDIDANIRQLAQLSPAAVLVSEPPLLIDEWQLVPEIWSHVKATVDSRQGFGQFILTGSSVPADDIMRDSAAGRVARLKMRPMSLLESGKSNGDVSLKKLFSQDFQASTGNQLSLETIVEMICKGGWPRSQELAIRQAMKSVQTYIEELAAVDLQRVSGIKFNKNNVLKVIKSLSRNVGTKASDKVIGVDAGSEGAPIDRNIVAGYLESLSRVFVTENNPSWTPRLRSRDRINGSATRYFIDPSIAVAAIGTSPKSLLAGEINYLGFLLENLVIRDLRIYMQALNGSVKQYRDSSGLEVDAILELEDNTWAAVEIKLGFAYIDQAASNLIRFRDKIDTEVCGAPAYLAVITATGPNYLREDGVYVISIGSLGP